MDVLATVNYEFIHENFDKYRGLVLPGGTRSTKTISALQWLIIHARANDGLHIVIARDTLKNLKRTILKDFIALCYGYGDYAPLDLNMVLNKSELVAKVNNSTFEFIGLIDDPMRVHGLKSDIFYINEAIGTYKSTFTQLNYRCSDGWILDCNPSEPMHWVYELESREDVKFFRSTYKDNPFLNDAQVFEIESKEPTPENIERGTADEREWSIYGKGLVYKGKEIIYPEWNTYSGTIEEYDNLFYGLDWGINHPLACVEVKINGNNLYVREIFYKSGVMDIEEELVPILMNEQPIKEGSTYVVYDSAEKKSGHLLVKNNIAAIPAQKPAGSVLTGIRKVGAYRMHVHEDSVNIQKELNMYKWNVDERTDTILDVPVKLNDDAMDAIRYPIYMFG